MGQEERPNMKLTYLNVFIVDFVRKLVLQTQLLKQEFLSFILKIGTKKIIKKDQLLKIGDLYEKDEIKDRKNLG